MRHVSCVLLKVHFKGTSGGPRHCIWTPDCSLKRSSLQFKAHDFRNCILLTGSGIVHLGPPVVPLRRIASGNKPAIFYGLNGSSITVFKLMLSVRPPSGIKMTND